MALLDRFAPGFYDEKRLSYQQRIVKIARLSILCKGICFACENASQNLHQRMPQEKYCVEIR